MFRLVRFLVSLVLLATFLWFALTVKLGEHTLFGHASRIGRSEPTQDLVEGTKAKAGELLEAAKQQADEAAPAPRLDAAPRRGADGGE